MMLLHSEDCFPCSHCSLQLNGSKGSWCILCLKNHWNWIQFQCWKKMVMKKRWDSLHHWNAVSFFTPKFTCISLIKCQNYFWKGWFVQMPSKDILQPRSFVDRMLISCNQSFINPVLIKCTVASRLAQKPPSPQQQNWASQVDRDLRS